jgi:hypothetical protein
VPTGGAMAKEKPLAKARGLGIAQNC